MTDPFIASVLADNGDGTYSVGPKIIENDGTTHIPVNAIPTEGIIPTVNDLVLVLPVKNNLDNTSIQRFFKSSEANGRIIAIVSTAGTYNLKGNYKFDGNFEITGTLTIDKDLTVKGNSTVNGNSTVDGDMTIKGNTTCQKKLDVTQGITCASLTIAGVDVMQHTHSGVTPGTGNSGTGTLL